MPTSDPPGDGGPEDGQVRGDRNPFGPAVPAFQAPAKAPVAQRVSPVTGNLRGYGKRALRPDLIAGLTVAALAIPAGMAYAELAGMSPVTGLYALILPAIVYALLGSSRQLSIGPDATVALLVAVSIAPLARTSNPRYAELAALLGLLVGAVYFLARLLRLGWIADYFSKPVLVGYIHGVVVVLIVGQLEKVLGLAIAAQDPLPQAREILREFRQISATTLIVALLSLVVLLALKRFLPKVPAALVVVIVGILASYAFSLKEHGVAVIGDIPSGLPSLSWPDVSAGDVGQLVPAALAIFAVSFADSILTARSFAGAHGQHVQVNQELVGLGAANIASGVSGAFPVSSSGSRTAVNDQSGGRTQLVGLVAAVVTGVVLLFLTEPVAKLPKACLGAVIVVAALGLVDAKAWKALAAAGQSQVVIAIITFVGVITIGVLKALIIAVALSIIDTVSHSATPNDAVLGWVERLGRYANVAVHPSARITPGVVAYRLDDKLFFANADYFRARVLEAIAAAPTHTRWLVLDAESITDVDASGVEAVSALLDDLDRQGIGLMVARIKSPLQAQFDATSLTTRIGEDNFAPNVELAVAACVLRMTVADAG